MLSASSMWMESDAINIDGMVRLYRLEGNYNDDGPNSKTLSSSCQIVFETETPYGHVAGSSSRQVVNLAPDAYASTDANGLPASDAPRTMMGWIRESSDSGQNWRVPFGYGTCASGKSCWHLVIHYRNDPIYGDDPIHAFIKVDSTYHTDNEIGTPTGTSHRISQNTWYHVAVSYDGTNISYHVNGELTAQGDPGINPYTSLDQFVLNFYATGHVESKYAGDLADVAVFNKALSTAEISAIYNAPEGLKSDANTVVGDKCLTGSSTPPSGLACDAATSTYNVLDGGSCSTNSECASGSCDSNSICKVSDGGTCANDTDCASGSCESTTSNSCLLSVGKTCSGGASDCASSFCVNSVCTDGANGSACLANSDCSSAYCDTSTTVCATAPVLDPCVGNNCSGHGRCYATSVSSSRCHCENTFVEVMNGNKSSCACPSQTELNPDINRCISTTSPPTSAPTNASTKSPTSNPTVSMTASPTASPSGDNCVDSSLAMKITVNGELKNKFCTWVARKKTESRCAMDTVSSHCPITCANYGGSCSVDSTARIKFTKEDGSSVMRYCTWIGSKPNKRCEYDGAVETCRNTCKEFSVRAI